MQPLIVPPAGASPLGKNSNFVSVWYLFLQALQQHVVDLESTASGATISSGPDEVFAVTNGSAAPALSGSGTSSAPFVLPVANQLIGVIATTQDVYLLLPSEASMLGLRAIACLSPANTYNVWLVTGSGDTLDGSSAAYQITVPSVTVEGGDANDYRITATVAASAVPTPDPAAPFSVTVVELASSRVIDLSDQSTSTTLEMVVQEAITPSGSFVLGTQIHIQLSSDGGANWYDAGQTVYDSDRNPAHEDGTHTYYQTTIDVPGVPVYGFAQTFKARAWATTSAIDGGPASATTSAAVRAGRGSPADCHQYRRHYHQRGGYSAHASQHLHGAKRPQQSLLPGQPGGYHSRPGRSQSLVLLGLGRMDRCHRNAHKPRRRGEYFRLEPRLAVSQRRHDAALESPVQ